jgi:hypothetical protein
LADRTEERRWLVLGRMMIDDDACLMISLF